MRQDLRRFAPFGLWLALFGTVCAIVFLVIFREYSFAVKSCIGLAILGLASYAMLDPSRALSVLTGRKARFGGMIFITTICFLGILTVINVLPYSVPLRFNLVEGHIQRFILPPQASTQNLLFLFIVLVLPSLALVFGIWVWHFRRMKG